MSPSSPGPLPSLGADTQLRALTVLESLTRFGGAALEALVRSIGGLPYLLSLIASEQQQRNSGVTVEALKIVGHVFEGNSPEGVQLCVHAGAMPLLCALAGNHACTKVRHHAVSALHDFIQCPSEIVASTIASYLGHVGGSDVSPVVITLVQKCRPHGDMALSVREKASWGVLNIARLTWIDAKIQETLVGSLADLLAVKNPQIVQETVEVLDVLLSAPKVSSSRATAAATTASSSSSSSSSSCMSSRLLHIFEASGGLEALESLLAETHLTAALEAKVEQVLAKHFPSTQITSMELDDNENNNTGNLLMMFADTVDANGRLW